MEYFSICHLLVCALGIILISNTTKAHESDIEWLEKILSAPRVKSNTVARRGTRQERNQDMFGEMEVLLNRFADTLRSKYKRSGWFTDDPGNRATDTTSTRAPTFAPTTFPTTTTEPPTSSTILTTTRRTVKFPSFPKFPPSWPWGKRRRRRHAILEKNAETRYVGDTADGFISEF